MAARSHVLDHYPGHCFLGHPWAYPHSHHTRAGRRMEQDSQRHRTAVILSPARHRCLHHLLWATGHQVWQTHHIHRRHRNSRGSRHLGGSGHQLQQHDGSAMLVGNWPGCIRSSVSGHDPGSFLRPRTWHPRYPVSAMFADRRLPGSTHRYPDCDPFRHRMVLRWPRHCRSDHLGWSHLFRSRTWVRTKPHRSVGACGRGHHPGQGPSFRCC
jgi:hypothetical protein